MDPLVQRTINDAIEHGALVEFYAAPDACLVVSRVAGEGVRAPRRPGDPGPQLHERSVPLRLSPGGSRPASEVQPGMTAERLANEAPVSGDHWPHHGPGSARSLRRNRCETGAEQ